LKYVNPLNIVGISRNTHREHKNKAKIAAQLKPFKRNFTHLFDTFKRWNRYLSDKDKNKLNKFKTEYEKLNNTYNAESVNKLRNFHNRFTKYKDSLQRSVEMSMFAQHMYGGR